MTAQEIEETRARLEAAGGIPGRKPARYVAARVLLEPEALTALQARAQEAGRSRNALVRDAVRAWLKKARRQAKAARKRG